MNEKGYGIIARMPLQFGLLSGKFTSATQFDETDHRSFRLTPEIIHTANNILQKIWPIADKYSINKALLAVSFILSFPEISTVIPGIRTVNQAIANAQSPVQLKEEEKQLIIQLFKSDLQSLLQLAQLQG